MLIKNIFAVRICIWGAKCLILYSLQELVWRLCFSISWATCPPMLVVHLHKEYFHYFRSFWVVVFKGKTRELPQRVPQDCSVWVGSSLEQQVTLPRSWPVTVTDTHGFISLQSATALWAWGSSSCSPSNQSSDWPCQSFAVTYYHKVNFLQWGRASNSGTDGNTEYF